MDTHAKFMKQYFAAFLLVSMLITRAKFVPASHYLPDATLALFFVGGIYFRKFVFVPLLFLFAGFIDYFSVENGGSGWCVTPAYGFLLPTYWVLWAGGRKFNDLGFESKKYTSMSVTLFVSTTLAFIISSGSFYLFSGYYEGSQIIQKSLSAYKYYPSYLMNPFCYVALAGMMMNLNIIYSYIQKDRIQPNN